MESRNVGGQPSNKRLIDATFEDLEQFLIGFFKAYEIGKPTMENKTVKGLKGIAKALDISTRQVSRLKKDGKLDKAIRQCGNLIYAKEQDLINCFNTIKKWKSS